MNHPEPSIVFVENYINHIFKTVEFLKHDFKNVTIYSGENELLPTLSENVPDVILLNLDLRPNDAVILVREIRKICPASPPFVVIYSDKQDDFVQELAFNSGADAFINFHQKAAVLKVFIQRLLQRRIFKEEIPQQKVYIDADRYVIYKQGEPLQLPRKEFKLFELLYNNCDKFFSKPEIAEAIWHDSAVARKRAIDVHIYNIRQIFGKRIIQSQKGKGYRINKKALT